MNLINHKSKIGNTSVNFHCSVLVNCCVVAADTDPACLHAVLWGCGSVARMSDVVVGLLALRVYASLFVVGGDSLSLSTSLSLAARHYHYALSPRIITITEAALSQNMATVDASMIGAP
jgi:hypothetical protein